MEHIHCQSVNHLEIGSVSIAIGFPYGHRLTFFSTATLVTLAPESARFPQQSTAQVLRGGPPAAPGQELGSHGVRGETSCGGLCAQAQPGD